MVYGLVTLPAASFKKVTCASIWKNLTIQRPGCGNIAPCPLSPRLKFSLNLQDVDCMGPQNFL